MGGDSREEHQPASHGDHRHELEWVLRGLLAVCLDVPGGDHGSGKGFVTTSRMPYGELIVDGTRVAVMSSCRLGRLHVVGMVHAIVYRILLDWLSHCAE